MVEIIYITKHEDNRKTNRKTNLYKQNSNTCISWMCIYNGYHDIFRILISSIHMDSLKIKIFTWTISRQNTNVYGKFAYTFQWAHYYFRINRPLNIDVSLSVLLSMSLYSLSFFLVNMLNICQQKQTKIAYEKHFLILCLQW